LGSARHIDGAGGAGAAHAALPVELAVVAGARGHYGPGSLLVEHGRLTLRLGPAVWIATGGLKEIVQTGGAVTAVRPRLLRLVARGPFLVLHDDTTGEIGAVQRDRWRTEAWPPPLEVAGFDVCDVVTWASLTAEPAWGEPPPGAAGS